MSTAAQHSSDRRSSPDVDALVAALPAVQPVSLVGRCDLLRRVLPNEAASKDLSPAGAHGATSLAEVVQDPQAVPKVLAAYRATAVDNGVAQHLRFRRRGGMGP